MSIDIEYKIKSALRVEYPTQIYTYPFAPRGIRDGYPVSARGLGPGRTCLRSWTVQPEYFEFAAFYTQLSV